GSWDAGKDCFALLLVELIGHGRRDKTRRYAIGRDVSLSVLGRHRLDHSNHTGFGSRVISLSRIAGKADHRRDADHTAPAPTPPARTRRRAPPGRAAHESRA